MKHNQKMALIHHHDLTDEEILELENEYDGDILTYLEAKGYDYTEDEI